MELFNKKISEIRPYENNPRDNSKAIDAVAASIREFGFKVPIVIDKNGVIVAGHTRYEASKKLGLEEVPCVIADDLTDEQVKAFRLADNKTAELASWNPELLEVEMSGIESIDMTEFGFIEPEKAEAVEDDFEIEPPEEPTAKRGEIWQLGAHRVMCGDSTDVSDVKKLLGGVQADLYLTDPPYNIGYEGKTKKKLTIENDIQDSDSFRNFLVLAFSAAKEVMKAGAAFYIWHADTEGYNFRGACMDVGWQVRENLIWSKDVFTLGRQDYQWRHEPCLYGWNEGSHAWYSDRKQSTILEFARPKRSEEHPTMKPIPLFDYQIRNSSKEGDIVFDSFGGSGTTIMACEQNGRKGYCMELDPKYVDVIIKRWETFTGKKAVLINE